MEELFASGIKLAYRPDFSFIFDIGEETNVSKIHRHLAKCPSNWVCANWAKYQENVSILLADITVEFNYAIGDFVGGDSKPLLCRLEDGVVIHVTLTMIMFHEDPRMRHVNDIIDHVFEAGLYIYWVSLEFNWRKISFSKTALFHQLAGY
jgi:hypothetical protein